MKKITLLIIGVTFVFVGYKSLPSGHKDPPGTMSGGAPTASTGAPSEKNCATSGCHSEFAPNSGVAKLAVSLENSGIKEYEPGKTYPITVSMTNPDIIRFGFQVVALRNSDNTNVGTIKLLDNERTQILPGYGTIADRRYITYTYEGTNAVSSGYGEWSFEWTAPETNEGPITFYIGSIAANDDGTDAGDYAYSKRITLDAPSVSWNITPTVSGGAFYLQSLGAPVQNFKVYNSSGQSVYERSSIEPGVTNLHLELPGGVYFISAVQNGKIEVRKIVISK